MMTLLYITLFFIPSNFVEFISVQCYSPVASPSISGGADSIPTASFWTNFINDKVIFFHLNIQNIDLHVSLPFISNMKILKLALGSSLCLLIGKELNRYTEKNLIKIMKRLCLFNLHKFIYYFLSIYSNQRHRT